MNDQKCCTGGDDCKCKCHQWHPSHESAQLRDAISRVLASKYPAAELTKEEAK